VMHDDNLVFESVLVFVTVSRRLRRSMEGTLDSRGQEEKAL
jgi:hypothetical protein